MLHRFTMRPLGDRKTFIELATLCDYSIFFYPIYKDHLCTVSLCLMYGLYSRAASNQERPMKARVRYWFSPYHVFFMIAVMSWILALIFLVCNIIMYQYINDEYRFDILTIA